MNVSAVLILATVVMAALNLVQCRQQDVLRELVDVQRASINASEAKAAGNAAAVQAIARDLDHCLRTAADASAESDRAMDRLAQLDAALERVMRERDNARRALYARDEAAREWAAQPVPEGVASQWRPTPEEPHR